MLTYDIFELVYFQVSLVDENGKYNKYAPKFLMGSFVLDEGNKLVLEHIEKDIVKQGQIIHSYPIDWRTKKPVIIRASRQWFINTEALKKTALNEVSINNWCSLSKFSITYKLFLD